MGYQQKSYKKFVATAATATLVASAIVPVASAAGFSDVAENNEFASYINALAEAGIINGYASDNTFRPSNKLTRGQVAIMLGRWLENNGETVPADWATNPRFSDVPASNEELAKYAALVKDAGVFTGVQGKLNPSQNITRENMAVVLDRVAIEVAGVSLVELAEEIEDVEVKDLKTAQTAYQDEIQALADLEITTVSNFRPKEQLSRAQFAKFLYKTFEIIEEITAPLTADELKAEVASIVGTLPAVNEITTVEKAQAAKTTATEATTALADIETVVAEGEYTEAEVTELNKAVTDAKTAIKAVVAKADQVIEDAKELVVESVQAINASKLEVKFSKAVDEASVETAAKYALVGTNSSNGALAISGNPELQADGKTVVIKLAATIANDSTVAVTVDPIALKGDANVTTERYSTTLKFNDTVKPTFVSSSNTVAGEVALKFSEELDQTTIIPANIQVSKAGVAQTVITTGTPATGEVLLTATADGFKLSGLEANVDYTVHAVNLKDLVGNLTSPNLVTTTVKSTFNDTVAPVVSDITTTGLDTVVVKVSEKLKDVSTTPGTTPAVFVTLSGVNADATQAQVYDADKGTVTIKVTPETQGAVKTISATAFSDVAGNAGATFSKTVSFSNISSVTKTEVVSKLNSAPTPVVADFVKFTFDKDITLAASGDLTAKLTTADNVVKTITIPYANLSKGTGTETNVLYAELTGLTGLEAGKLVVTLDDAVITTLSKDADVTVNYTPSDANAPKVATAIASTATAQTLTVNYDKNMGQSALDVNNYTVDGAKVFESAIFSGDKKTVELTFKKGTVVLDGAYDFEIASTVKAENGVALKNKYTEQVTLKENVAPTVKSAKVVNNGTQVEVTFSEAVTDGTTADKDFDVYVAGTKYSVATTTASSNVVTLDLATALDAAALSKTITIKALETLDIKDTNGNKAIVSADVNVAK